MPLSSPDSVDLGPTKIVVEAQIHAPPRDKFFDQNDISSDIFDRSTDCVPNVSTNNSSQGGSPILLSSTCDCSTKASLDSRSELFEINDEKAELVRKYINNNSANKAVKRSHDIEAIEVNHVEDISRPKKFRKEIAKSTKHLDDVCISNEFGPSLYGRVVSPSRKVKKQNKIVKSERLFSIISEVTNAHKKKPLRKSRRKMHPVKPFIDLSTVASKKVKKSLETKKATRRSSRKRQSPPTPEDSSSSPFWPEVDVERCANADCSIQSLNLTPELLGLAQLSPILHSTNFSRGTLPSQSTLVQENRVKILQSVSLPKQTHVFPPIISEPILTPIIENSERADSLDLRKESVEGLVDFNRQVNSADKLLETPALPEYPHQGIYRMFTSKTIKNVGLSEEKAFEMWLMFSTLMLNSLGKQEVSRNKFEEAFNTLLNK